MPPLTAFLTGLTTGGLTCFAVQGGLLLGLLAHRDEGRDPNDRSIARLVMPVGAFLVAKLIAYTLLGLALGWFGDAITLSTAAQLWLQGIAAAFMIVTGIRLIAPGFLPWLSLPAPAPIRRFIRHRAKSTSIVAPAVLGFLTILIPCGTTQAMEVAAIASGSVLQAASIMFAFVLGTAPLFFTIGVLARGTGLAQRRLTAAAAVLVIGLGLYAFNGILVATDSPYEFRSVVTAVQAGLSKSPSSGSDDEAQTTATITVKANGYSPTSLTVPANEPVQLKLQSKGPLGCTSLFRIPKLDLETDVPRDSSTTLTATFPAPGRYVFTCGMGMYSGTIEAI